MPRKVPPFECDTEWPLDFDNPLHQSHKVCGGSGRDVWRIHGDCESGGGFCPIDRIGKRESPASNEVGQAFSSLFALERCLGSIEGDCSTLWCLKLCWHFHPIVECLTASLQADIW